jgi:hypothetical protein
MTALQIVCRTAEFVCRAAGFFAWPLIDHALADYPLQDEWMNERSDQQRKRFRLAAKRLWHLFGTPAS